MVVGGFVVVFDGLEMVVDVDAPPVWKDVGRSVVADELELVVFSVVVVVAVVEPLVASEVLSDVFVPKDLCVVVLRSLSNPV